MSIERRQATTYSFWVSSWFRLEEMLRTCYAWHPATTLVSLKEYVLLRGILWTKMAKKAWWGKER